MIEPRYLLMCEPTHFGVSYVINPWMQGNIANTSLDRATAQWRDLLRVLARRARIELVEPHAGLPDMVFTANAGFVLDDVAVVSRFRHLERQGEEPHFESWFRSRRFSVLTMPADMPFEGAGDALVDRARTRIWAAWGHRSARASHELLAKWLGVEVISLRLVDSRFYHLDTCFCPLEGGPILYYPAAFDEESNRIIERQAGAHSLIPVTEEDALYFACNAVNVGSTVVMNKASAALRACLAAFGYTLIETELTEFLKAGGGAKCLTLRLNEPRQRSAASRIA